MQLEYNIYFEISAAFFMCFLLLYVKTQFNLENAENLLFFRIGEYVLVADILDVITAITISNATMIPISWNILLNTVYLLVNGVLSYFYMKYSMRFRDIDKMKHIFPYADLVILVCYIFVLLANMFGGFIFSFSKEGGYVHGPIYMIIYIVPYLYFMMAAWNMIKSISRFSGFQRFSLLMCNVISFAGAALQVVVFPDILLNIFAMSLAYVILLFALETPEYQRLRDAMEELRLANARANAANEAKSRFLASMSHEIRTPINAVLGMDEMILRESTEEQIISYAKNIDVAGNTLLTLINDILDFSKIESGKMELFQAEYDVAEMIEKMQLLIKPRVDEKELEFIVECDKTIPRRLYGDELRIRQVIMNLLTNAVKYTKQGSVTFRMKWKKEADNHIILLASVEDSGIGISEENQEKLFASFSRVDAEQTHNIEGTGLGLAITKQLVELMDGQIGVYSTEGKGSLFYVELPQTVVMWEPIGDTKVAEPKEKTSTLYEEKFHAPTARILVVDDVSVNLMVMKGLLKKTQIIIDTAESGRECLSKCKDTEYDIILLDHMMPEMDGIETLKLLKSGEYPLNRNVPVIMLTANAISGAEEEYKKLGFEGYISKPATGETLENALLSFLPKEKIEIAS